MRALSILSIVSMPLFAEGQDLPGRERPRVLASLVSVCGTAHDYRTTFDMASSAEVPLRGKDNLLAGLRIQSHRPENAAYDGSFRRIGLSGHLAARRYPWEWAEGFFVQAGLGYGRDWGTATRYREGGPEEGWVAYAHHQDHQTLEAALGFGYRWHAGPLVIDGRFAFGPKRIVRKEYDGRSAPTSADWMESLLRFQDLEVGFSI